MANVDKIAKLRGTSSIEAIDFWNQVCRVAGTSLSTDKVREALHAQGENATTKYQDRNNSRFNGLF